MTTMNGPVRLYMSMSLDGYIAGPDDRPGQELGAGGFRLFNWLDDRESAVRRAGVQRSARDPRDDQGWRTLTSCLAVSFSRRSDLRRALTRIDTHPGHRPTQRERERLDANSTGRCEPAMNAATIGRWAARIRVAASGAAAMVPTQPNRTARATRSLPLKTRRSA